MHTRTVLISILALLTSANAAAQEAEPPPDVASASPAASVPEFGALRVYVHPPEMSDVEPFQRTLFARSLLDELNKLEGIEASAEAAGQSSDGAGTCPDRVPSCLAQLGERLGADVIVTANAVSLGDSKSLSLKAVRIADATVTGAVTRQMTGSDGEEYLLILGEAVQELFADRGVEPGQERGVPMEVVKKWSPAPLEPWHFWTGVGLTGAAGIASVVLVLLTKDAEDDYNSFAKEGNTAPISGATLVQKADRAESYATMGNVAIVSTLVLGGATALVWMFTDWPDEPSVAILPTDDGFAAAISAEF